MRYSTFREGLGWMMLTAREVAGWGLILVSFYMFYRSYHLMVDERNWFAGWPLTLGAIFVFRGGIHLLKVAVAAKVCQETQEQLYPVAPPVRPSAGPLERYAQR